MDRRIVGAAVGGWLSVWLLTVRAASAHTGHDHTESGGSGLDRYGWLGLAFVGVVVTVGFISLRGGQDRHHSSDDLE